MPNPTPEEIRDFVIAGHGDIDKVKTLLAAQPALLNLAHRLDKQGDHGAATTLLQQVLSVDAAADCLSPDERIRLRARINGGGASQMPRML